MSVHCQLSTTRCCQSGRCTVASCLRALLLTVLSVPAVQQTPLSCAETLGCCCVQINKATVNMLKRVEPYVAWGYPNLKTVKELIYKRGYGKVWHVDTPLRARTWVLCLQQCALWYFQHNNSVHVWAESAQRVAVRLSKGWEKIFLQHSTAHARIPRVPTTCSFVVNNVICSSWGLCACSFQRRCQSISTQHRS